MARIRLAFLGFRHGHVMGLYKSAAARARVEIVASVDEDEPSAKAANVTHEKYDRVINSPDIDAVAVGEVFARRGEIIIAALRGGKHVIADKPICTRLPELDRIEKLARERDRAVGCLLDLRDHGPFLTMRRLIDDGAIGEVHTINFTAQHPLLFGKRPAWYFEEGKQGGTINDIAIHAIDLIPWLTGRSIDQCIAARAWNARHKAVPWFQDGAQIMLKLDNGGGVLGDLSYLAPDALAYAADQYWRVTCHGDRGVVETNYNAKSVSLATDGPPQSIPADANRPTGRLDAFLDEIDSVSRPGELTTADVLAATRLTLQIQALADAAAGTAPALD